MKTLRIPLQLDSRRRLSVVSSPDEVVRTQILDILVTGRRERPFRPGYGAGVPEMFFGTVDPNIFGAKEAEIRAALRAKVVGGTVRSVKLSGGTDGNLSVTVSFTLAPGGPSYDAVQTFDGIATEESFTNV
jgi:phage baseplate assembly protein W